MQTGNLRLYADTQYASPYAMSVFVALEEKGLTYERVTVDLGNRAHFAPDYAATSLTQRVPTLVHDDFALSEALRVGCFYVGALGSRKTHAKRVERLKEMGRTENEIGRIAAPIGLDIGAASPAEIALATLAQIVQAFRRRDLVTAG